MEKFMPQEKEQNYRQDVRKENKGQVGVVFEHGGIVASRALSKIGFFG
jgi:hypothetical protein